MTYTNQYKERCFRVLRYSNIDVRKLMSALDAGNDTLVRYVLEDAIDDEELYEKSAITDEGDRIVCNAKINAYKERVELYSEFMEKYVNVLDGELIEA